MNVIPLSVVAPKVPPRALLVMSELRAKRLHLALGLINTCKSLSDLQDIDDALEVYGHRMIVEGKLAEAEVEDLLRCRSRVDSMMDSVMRQRREALLPSTP